MLQPRLSAHAAEELTLLESALERVTLTAGRDDRNCFYEDNKRRLDMGLIYKTSVRDHRSTPAFVFVWKNFAPSRASSSGQN